jgi:hypothetical protein
MNKMIFKASKKFVALELKSSPILASAAGANELAFKISIKNI